jgi:FAD/FMN-containing dehydrogenase
MVNISAIAGHVEQRAEYESWAASLADALSGGLTMPAYPGFMGDEGQAGIHRAYPTETLTRLVQVKRRYDPDNVFHPNLNVAPD